MNSSQPFNQRIATKAVIINDKNQVLILREANSYDEGTNGGRYQVPGGRLNPGEPYMDGLKREVMEETGLSVKIGKPIFVGEWFPVIKDVPNQIVAMYFICNPLDDEIVLSEEHDDYKWISEAELKDYDIIAPEPEAILAALQS